MSLFDFVMSWLLLSSIALFWAYGTGMEDINRKWKLVVWFIIVLPVIFFVYYFLAIKTVFKDFAFDFERLKGGL